MNIVLNEVRTAPEKTDGQLMPLSRYILGARGQTGNKPASSHAGLQPFISADLQRPSFFAVASSPQQPVRPPLSVYRKTLSLYAWVRGKSRFHLPGGQGLPVGHAASLEPGARRRTSVDARVGLIDRISRRRRTVSGSTGTRCPPLAGSPRTHSAAAGS